jgi:hypothetical protein
MEASRRRHSSMRRPNVFRQQQRQPVAISKREPTGVARKRGRFLFAAMQHDDQRSRGFSVRRDIAKHPQIAGVGAKPGLLARLRGISAGECADRE